MCNKLERLTEYGIEWFLSTSYVGWLAFDDDGQMVWPTVSGMILMYNICENYDE